MLGNVGSGNPAQGHSLPKHTEALHEYRKQERLGDSFLLMLA